MIELISMPAVPSPKRAPSSQFCPLAKLPPLAPQVRNPPDCRAARTHGLMHTQETEPAGRLKSLHTVSYLMEGGRRFSP